jgi:hypothetical protein
MSSEKGSAGKWLVFGLLGTLFACMCFVLVAGAGSVLFLNRMGSVSNGPVPVTSVAQPSTPFGAPQATSAPTPIPDAAVESEKTLMKAEVPIADPISLAERFRGVENIPEVVATSAAPVDLGTVESFWASDPETQSNFQVQAKLVYATAHAYFWVEQGVNYNQSDVKKLMDTFENKIYPTDREFFGSEWSPGVDGDVHLYLLFARGLGNSIAGYFSSQDSYSSQVHKYSNQHEMFYLSADNLNLSDEFTYGVLAHEFQHMIHWHLDRNEETWMNEGFSELASLLNHYDVGGFDYLYAQDTDKNLTYWPSEPGTTGAYYGHSFLFLSYFLQRFGHEATQALVANPDNGLDSVDETLKTLNETDPQTGDPITADDVYRDWGAAMVLQDAAMDDGRYAITEYSSAPRAAVTDQFDSCPMGPQDRTVNQYGVDYMEITCTGQHTIHFNGASLAPVMPADPHTGDFDFYSNKGDESDMTLTRSFDFTGTVGSIDFSYWTWFDIEDGWDYVYLEASDDNGTTWKILKTPSGTDRDPSGNAYGWGYTGLSGGSSQQATWIKESVDLSDYAGKQIVLRFEYVTDAAVNGEGFLLDDLSIDAINYREGFEQDDGGWQADGFVRLYNRLPQTYQVALITEGNAPSVQVVSLDDNRDADIPVSIGGDVDRVILMVIGTTRHTWQETPYTVSISP